MGFEPPKSESSRGLPGIVIPLIFLSIILLGAVLVFGALAFDVSVPGFFGDEPEVAAPEEALVPSGFVLREQRVEGETMVMEVEVGVANTGDQPVEAFQMLVQCDDNGYVSAIQEVSGLAPGESRTVAMELAGRGEPDCHDPVVEFSPVRQDG